MLPLNERAVHGGGRCTVHGLPIRTGCKALRRKKRHTYMVISVYCNGNERDQVMSMLPDTLPLAKRLPTLHTTEPWQTEVCNTHALFYVLYGTNIEYLWK